MSISKEVAKKKTEKSKFVWKKVMNLFELKNSLKNIKIKLHSGPKRDLNFSMSTDKQTEVYILNVYFRNLPKKTIFFNRL